MFTFDSLGCQIEGFPLRFNLAHVFEAFEFEQLLQTSQASPLLTRDSSTETRSQHTIIARSESCLDGGPGTAKQAAMRQAEAAHQAAEGRRASAIRDLQDMLRNRGYGNT